MTRMLLAFLCTAHCTGAVAAPLQTGVFVDFTKPPASTFKTTASYQIVTNPLLDKTYELANGSVIPNPIHDNAWASVKNLNADHVRFQPWFPFPHKVRLACSGVITVICDLASSGAGQAVPELAEPVDNEPTSWTFQDFMPQVPVT